MVEEYAKQATNQEEALLPACFVLVSCKAYSSALKMEAIYFSVTLVDFQRTTRRYIPEDKAFR
jgi:hypothetical protein